MTAERLLIVENDAKLRKSLAEMLEPDGFELDFAEDGAQSLARALANRPKLIITSQNLPDITGLEAIEGILEAGLYIPTILVTSNGSEELATQALRLGVVDYLPKPPKAEALREAVVRGLNRTVVGGPAATGLDIGTIWTLGTVGHTITTSLDLDFVLREIVEKAVELTRAEEGVLMLLDLETEELYTRATKSADEETVQSLRLPVSDSIAGEVINTGEPFVASSGEHKIKTQYLVKSLLYVPLYLMGQAIGVLGVSNRDAEGDFSPIDVEVLGILANYAAISMANARASDAANVERARFMAMLENSSDAVIVVDDAGFIVFINQGAAEALGVELLDILGRRADEAIVNRDLREMLKEEATKNVVRGEVALPNQRIFNAQISHLTDLGSMVVLQDVTHLKELDAMKTKFVTTVSHDLRSPLTAILGYIEFVGRAGELNEQQKLFVQRVKSSVHAMTNLINDLLDLGRIEAGIDRKKEPLKLQAVLQQVYDSLKTSADSKQQELTLEYSDDLPEMIGNSLRLRQALSNLIENAVKYTPEGGKVGVTAVTTDNQLVVTVRDTGVGIPLADQPHIFDEFYRSDEVVEEYVGTGLGLAIVKSIVEAHDGRVWVESKLGEGTTFVVMLPCYGPEAEKND